MLRVTMENQHELQNKSQKKKIFCACLHATKEIVLDYGLTLVLLPLLNLSFKSTV